MYENPYDDLNIQEEHERAFARCESCKELIYEDSDNDDVYIDEDGNYFCSLECALDYHSIKKIICS